MNKEHEKEKKKDTQGTKLKQCIQEVVLINNSEGLKLSLRSLTVLYRLLHS